MPLLSEKKRAASLAEMVGYFSPHHPNAEGVLKCTGTVTYQDSKKELITEALRFEVSKFDDECTVIINWKKHLPPEGLHAKYQSPFDLFQAVSPSSFVIHLRKADLTFEIHQSVFKRFR